MNEYDAIVVGGNGAVGTLLCTLLSRGGRSVMSVDTRPFGTAVGTPALPAGEVDREIGDIVEPGARLTNLLRGAGTVVLAVPESVALNISLTLFTETALVVETLSVKSAFAAKIAREGVAGPVLGINPMFAPSLGMEGRPVAAVTHSPGAAAEEFLGRIRGWGGRVVEVDSDTHDRLAAATQALTHAAVLAFGSALTRLHVDPGLVEAVAPPPARTALALLARIAAGEPEVYWDVQAGNPHAAAARSALADAVRDMDAAVDTVSEGRFGEYVRAAGAAVPDIDAYGDLCARLFGIVRGSAREGDQP
ncbi:MAG: prephenate dehydrogenase dimerization domain-containing protein [Rhodococcus sp. (in: high G+C Gram-positive bacteria)]